MSKENYILAIENAAEKAQALAAENNVLAVKEAGILEGLLYAANLISGISSKETKSDYYRREVIFPICDKFRAAMKEV